MSKMTFNVFYMSVKLLRTFIQCVSFMPSGASLCSFFSSCVSFSKKKSRKACNFDYNKTELVAVP